MGSITLDEILEFVAGAIILFQFGKWIVSFANPIVDLRKRLDKHDQFFANDKEKIEKLTDTINHTDEGLAIVGMALAELINHTVTGNDIDELKKQQKEIMNFFFIEEKKGVK